MPLEIYLMIYNGVSGIFLKEIWRGEIGLRFRIVWIMYVSKDSPPELREKWHYCEFLLYHSLMENEALWCTVPGTSRHIFCFVKKKNRCGFPKVSSVSASGKFCLLSSAPSSTPFRSVGGKIVRSAGGGEFAEWKVSRNFLRFFFKLVWFCTLFF